MSVEVLEAAALFALVWPFVAASLWAVRAARPWVIGLLPWSAAPALAVALLVPDLTLPLPETLLGSGLALDATGRVFLATTALLWWVASALMVGRRPGGGGERRSVLPALLAMGAGFTLALADNGLLWFAAGTLAGYAVYALILQDAARPARAAGRRLVILLVLSDLLLFELFLILAHAAGGTSFADLRGAVAALDNPTFVLALMTLGFGVKAAVLGVHLWLLPAFGSTTLGVRVALITFVAAAGLLGWLRLLPLGEMTWTAEGVALHGWAFATAATALMMGFLWAGQRALAGGILMALTGQWLWALAAALQRPESGVAIAALLPMLALQSSLALAALVLLDDAGRTRHRALRMAMAWLAVVLVVLAPLPLFVVWIAAGPLFALDLVALDPVALELAWPSVAVALLLGRFIAGMTPHEGASSRSRSRHPQSRMTLGAGLLVASAVGAATGLLGYPPTGLWSPIQADAPDWSYGSAVAVAVLVGAVSLGWLASLRARQRPAPGSVGWSPTRVPALHERLRALRGQLRHILRSRLPGWRDAILDALAAAASSASACALVRRAEARLMRWESALAMLLLAGLAVGWSAFGG
ncbi:proton-conducting transporter membrane subunit [Thiocapsa sp.]|uniref:proton-conducting transporter transmembrane domain-containing protein n=1 Tax=Thiocapsa sp. TaxID=2024551 RepID=UPI002D0FE219|nr:proton-conducting transporter membrane subunit [Thiocapsa sp.]HSO81425.1 proton-conducting transporter membrane subunit [Thiocapsa sp.]